MNKYAIICICSINWKICIHIRSRNGPGLTGSVQDWPEAVNSSLKLIWANQHYIYNLQEICLRASDKKFLDHKSKRSIFF